MTRKQVQCDSCGRVWKLKQIIPIEDCDGLLERVLPGEILPYGECRKCGAFCHEVKKKPKVKRQVHVGMYHKNRHAELFCMQLCHDDGKAHASVSMENGLTLSILCTEEYSGKHEALVRLAQKTLAKVRKRNAAF